MNVSDSERVATRLVSDGFEITANEAAADIILINTCSVREKAEHKLYTRVGQIRKSEKENNFSKKQIVGVLGCVAQLEGETLFAGRNEIDFVLGTTAVGRVSEAIEKVLGGQKNYFDLGMREESYDWSVAENQRHSPFVAFVPISKAAINFVPIVSSLFHADAKKVSPPQKLFGRF